MTKSLQWTQRLNQERIDEVLFTEFGDAYTEYRSAWNGAGPASIPDFPIHLDIELADACNLRCKHCFRHEEVAAQMEIEINSGTLFPMELYDRILEEGRSKGLRAINLGFSGECLVNKHFADMTQKARDAGVLDIRTITNGLLITPEKADMLLETPLTFLGISIDAGTPETFAQLKGQDGYEKLREMVRYIHRRKQERGQTLPLVRASYYVSPEAKEEIPKFLEDFQAYVDFIDFQNFKNVRQTKIINREMECFSPFRRLAVFTDGKVAPCCSFFSKKVIIGDVNSKSIEEIWNGEPIRLVRDELAEGTPNPVCQLCLSAVKDQ